MDRQMMDRVIQGARTKSEAIRRLHDVGVKTADIAAHLGIIYQFAYNVVAAAEAKKSEGQPDFSDDEQAPGISIEEAKRALAVRFGVNPEAIEITIRG